MRDYYEIYDLYLDLQAEMSFGLERALFNFPEFQDAETVIDVGCGNASYARLLANAFPAKRVVGLDPDGTLLGRASKRSMPTNLELLHCAIDDVPASIRPDIVISRLVSMYLTTPDQLSKWAAQNVAHSLVIDAADDLFSVYPAMPLFAATERANAARILAMGGDRSVVDRLVEIWTGSGHTLRAEHDVLVQSSVPFAKAAFHQLIRLHAELAVGNPLDRELIDEIFDWSINPSSYLQYGFRARHFVTSIY